MVTWRNPRQQLEAAKYQHPGDRVGLAEERRSGKWLAGGQVPRAAIPASRPPQSMPSHCEQCQGPCAERDTCREGAAPPPTPPTPPLLPVPLCSSRPFSSFLSSILVSDLAFSLGTAEGEELDPKPPTRPPGPLLEVRLEVRVWAGGS